MPPIFRPVLAAVEDPRADWAVSKKSVLSGTN